MRTNLRDAHRTLRQLRRSRRGADSRPPDSELVTALWLYEHAVPSFRVPRAELVAKADELRRELKTRAPSWT